MRQERATISAGPRRSDAGRGWWRGRARSTYHRHLLSVELPESLRPRRLTGVTLHLEVLVALGAAELEHLQGVEVGGERESVRPRAHRAEDNANNSPLSPGAAPDGYEPCCRYERTSCHGPGSTSTSRRSTFQDALVLVSEPRRQPVLLLALVHREIGIERILARRRACPPPPPQWRLRRGLTCTCRNGSRSRAMRWGSSPRRTSRTTSSPLC